MGKPPGKEGRASGRQNSGDTPIESSGKAGKRRSSGERFLGGERNTPYLVAAAVSLVTFLMYLFCLKNDLLSWDDDEYITNNPIIRSFDFALIKSAFLEFRAANWHPLTWISHALDYTVWGLNPLGHHLTNNLLHAANTFLVVVLVTKLVKAYRETAKSKDSTLGFTDRGALIIAGVTGLLFGIHPLHVESVAWVAERKDLLCGLFFLLSLLMYTRYVSSKEPRGGIATPFLSGKYLSALGFFIPALLSKPMAVSLPAVLLILDWYPFRRIESGKTFGIALFQKLPFVALSLLSSIVTLLAQKAAGATLLTEHVPLTWRMLVAGKAIVSYLLKMVFPLNLMPIYPYPRDIEPSSFEYSIPLIIIACIQAACFMTMKRHKLWLSVWSYYVVTLLPVLGLVQVGGQAMADRYTYLPSLGPFLVVGSAVAWIFSRVNLTGIKASLISGLLGAVAVSVLFVTMSYLTIEQMSIWRNDIDLWTYVIEKAPVGSTYAYFKRGKAFADRGQPDKALADYDTIVSLEPYHADVYFSRGLLFAKMRRFDKAIEQYSQAILWNQYGAGSNVGREFYFLYRGLAYLELGQVPPAISDFRRACDSGSQPACNNLKSLESSGYSTR
ncbi:MAG TPA: tetratricopeptide repeat protein [Thermodesulfovibrionales bacterium]|nr:tetratricopeptide repeat protein [Thermodesulfovibrionales bacterium]